MAESHFKYLFTANNLPFDRLQVDSMSHCRACSQLLVNLVIAAHAVMHLKKCDTENIILNMRDLATRPWAGIGTI
jgi:hypothetical protein